ncbi:MAG: type II toxin-antitoxin system RelE family toxin [Chroococcales cyanobacterium]
MDEYPIEFLPTATQQFIELPRIIQERIAGKIDQLKINPYPPGARKLTYGTGQVRLRVGYYRIIYSVNAETPVIVILKIGHRKQHL